MKQIRLLLSAMLIMLFTACSSDSAMMEYINADHMLAVSISPKAFLESTGSTVSSDRVELSPEMQRLFDNNGASDDIMAFLNNGILKMDKIMIVCDYDKRTKDVEPIMICEINYLNALTSFLDEKGFEKSNEKGDIVTYYQNGASLAIVDDLLFCSNYGPQELATGIQKLKKAAKKNPLPDDLADVLTDSDHAAAIVGNIDKLSKALSSMNIQMNMGFSMLLAQSPQLANGYMAADLKFKGDEADLNVAFYDKDGKSFKLINGNNTPDTSLLKYTTTYDSAVLLMNVADCGTPDFAKNLSGTQLAPLADVLSNMQSLMVACGAVDPSTNSYHGVIAVKFKSGKANDVYSMLKEAFGNYTTTADGGICVNDGGESIYCRLDGDVLVASLNSPIATDGRSPIKASDFGKGMLQIVARFPVTSGGSNILGLPFGIDAEASINSKGYDVEVTLTDTNKPFLQTLLSLAN